MTLVPKNILDAMDPAQRRAYQRERGRHRNEFRTQTEIEQEVETKTESTLRKQVLAFCARNELGVIESRTDKRPTIKKGWPDLTVYRRLGQVTLMALLELKTAKGRLSADQELVIAQEAARGVPVHICRSLGEAQDALIRELQLLKWY